MMDNGSWWWQTRVDSGGLRWTMAVGNTGWWQTMVVWCWTVVAVGGGQWQTVVDSNGERWWTVAVNDGRWRQRTVDKVNRKRKDWCEVEKGKIEGEKFWLRQKLVLKYLDNYQTTLVQLYLVIRFF